MARPDMARPVPDTTPARIYLNTLAFAAWLADHEDLAEIIRSVDLYGEHITYDVILHVELSPDRALVQARVDRIAAALGCATDDGWDPAENDDDYNGDTVRQWSLDATREFMGERLHWHATAVQTGRQQGLVSSDA
jgi:hypothetical protein